MNLDQLSLSPNVLTLRRNILRLFYSDYILPKTFIFGNNSFSGPRILGYRIILYRSSHV